MPDKDSLIKMQKMGLILGTVSILTAAVYSVMTGNWYGVPVILFNAYILYSYNNQIVMFKQMITELKLQPNQ